MTREDIKQIIKILQLNYPSTYRGMGKDSLKGLIDLWMEMFGKYEASIVGGALKSYIKDNEYPPTIAGLQKHIDLIESQMSGGSVGVDEMWTAFRKAVQSAYPGNTEELFKSLPVPVQKFVGNHGEILNFGLLDMNEFRTVTKGQFYREVSQRIEAEKEINKLPAEIKVMIENVSTKQIGEINEK